MAAWNPYPPLPAGALRDLLGITRAFYRAAHEAEPRDERLVEALADIGKGLQAALRGARATPGTIEHGNAWAAARQAAAALSGLVGGVALATLVEATVRKLAQPGAMVSSTPPKTDLRTK